MKEEEENGEVKKAGGSDGREDETDRVRTTMERETGVRRDEGAKGNKRCVRRGAFFFGPVVEQPPCDYPGRGGIYE